jgi:hypothetical protein
MATIPARRPNAWVERDKGGPPVVFVPLDAAQTGVAGDLAIGQASGLVTHGTAGNANVNTVIGIHEVAYGTAPASGTLTPVTLILPGMLYEFTFAAAAARTAVWDVAMTASTTGNAGCMMVVGTATVASDAGWVGIGFATELTGSGTFNINRYLSEAGTSATGAQSVVPNATTHGVVGDTNPRMVFVAKATLRLGVGVLSSA